ncbi:MAG: hypothetical protein IPL96_03185 [Holophagaceae bacterium]|nr:hypothetical protein [Holophagaceae bacterium]
MKPGEHSIYTDEKEDALTFPIEAGRTYDLRVAIQAGAFKGHGKLVPVDKATGTKEVEAWKPKDTTKILKP